MTPKYRGFTFALAKPHGYSMAKLQTVKDLACEQAPVGDSRVQSRANGMSRERSGEEGVRRGAPPRPTRFARGVTTL